MMMPEGVKVQQRTKCEYNVSAVYPIAFREENAISVSHGGHCERNCLTGCASIQSGKYVKKFLQ